MHFTVRRGGEEGCSLFVGLPRTNTAKKRLSRVQRPCTVAARLPLPNSDEGRIRARVQAKSLSFGSREVFLCLSKYRNFVPLKGIFCPGKWHENTGLGLTLACSLPCPVRSREAVTSWRRRASAGVPCRRPDARCNPTQRGKFQALYLVQIHK